MKCPNCEKVELEESMDEDFMECPECFHDFLKKEDGTLEDFGVAESNPFAEFGYG